MKTDIKISIVMPVYNTNPEYLEKAVDSVLNQTYGNFELIIVDDGSQEECAALCDRIQKKDSRIRVLHQENAGVSVARNMGTLSAEGEYVMYMDSDDLLAYSALREAVEIAGKTEAQFIFAGVQHITDYSEFDLEDHSEELQYCKYEKDEIDIVMKSFFTQRNKDFKNIKGRADVIRGPVARLIKIDVARKVKFEGRLKLGEDVEWNMRLLQACECVCFVPSVWYGYLIYGGSSLRKYYGNRAQLLEEYHTLLFERNREFCEKDLFPYALNMAVSFYVMVEFEYQSEKCKLSHAGKRRELKQILKREPWTVLSRKDILRRLPLRYRGLIIACRFGMGIEFVKLWGGIRKWKKKFS